MQEGFELGFQLGFPQGFPQGKLELMVQLLSDRFGDLNATRRQRIENLSDSQLNQLATQSLHFTNLNDLDTWLQTPPSSRAKLRLSPHPLINPTRISSKFHLISI